MSFLCQVFLDKTHFMCFYPDFDLFLILATLDQTKPWLCIWLFAPSIENQYKISSHLPLYKHLRPRSVAVAEPTFLVYHNSAPCTTRNVISRPRRGDQANFLFRPQQVSGLWWGSAGPISWLTPSVFCSADKVTDKVEKWLHWFRKTMSRKISW